MEKERQEVQQRRKKILLISMLVIMIFTAIAVVYNASYYTAKSDIKIIEQDALSSKVNINVLVNGTQPIGSNVTISAGDYLKVTATSSKRIREIQYKIGTQLFATKVKDSTARITIPDNYTGKNVKIKIRAKYGLISLSSWQTYNITVNKKATDFVIKYVQENQENETLDNLKNEIKTIVSERNFSYKKMTSLSEDIASTVYNNYDNFYNVYKILGYPNKSEFIKTDLINTIADKEQLQDVESRPYTNEEIGGLAINRTKIGGTYDFGDKKININTNIIANLRGNLVQTIFHELTHSGQTIINKMAETYGGDLKNEDLAIVYYGLVEGEAYQQEYIMSVKDLPYSVLKNNSNYNIINSGNKTIVLNPNVANSGYTIYNNMFVKMLTVIGYDKMEDILHNASSKQYIIDVLKTELPDTGEELFNLINVCNGVQYSKIYKNGNYSVDIADLIKLENMILDNLADKMSQNINSKETALEYFNLYRVYKRNYMFKYTVDKKYDYSVFNIDNIENILINKLIEYNAIPKFTENEALYRMGIKAILFAEITNDKQFLPTNMTHILNILNTNITYNEYTNGNAKITFEDKYCIAFNSKKIISLGFLGTSIVDPTNDLPENAAGFIEDDIIFDVIILK